MTIDLTAIDRDYREIGPASLRVWEAEYEKFDSPLLPYVEEMHAAAGEHSALCLAMQYVENQFSSTGIIIQPEDYNPLSARPWLEDPTATVTGIVIDWQTRERIGDLVTKDGRVVVRNGTIKVPPGAIGAIRASDNSLMLRFANPVFAVQEWRRRIIDDPTYKGGPYTATRTLAEMLAVYAPPGDTHPESGLDNSEINYAGVVRKKLADYAEMEGGATGGGTGVTEGDETNMDKPYIIIAAGHRSTNDPGNPKEKALTEAMARDYVAALRKAGIEADWLQRDLDRDSNATQTVGDLATVVNVVRRVMPGRITAHPNQLAVYVELHYDGAHAPCHVIVPDNRGGLANGYSDGYVASDTAANNTLDVELAKTTAANIVAATGLGMFTGTLGIPGVMSETESGVAQGIGTPGNVKYRLGMFSGTAIFRNSLVRLVIEHGGTDDAPVQKPDFTQTCAAAFVKAVSQVFGIGGTTTPLPIDPPDVEPEKPSILTYPPKINRAIATELFGQVTGSDQRVYGFDERGPVSQRWLALGKLTGRFPALAKAFVSGDVKYFTFSDGTLIVDEKGAVTVIEPQAEA